MLSIIIPTKQEEKYIADAIRQFESLSVPREIIVSDGKSTDTTVQIAQQHAAKTVIFTGEHHNPGIGRNDGAKASIGDILLFIDADTRLKVPEEFIRHALKRFEEDPKLLGIACSQHVLPSEKRPGDGFVFGLDNFLQHFYNNILKIGWACGKCMVVRKSGYEKVGGFPEHLVFGEDHYFFTKLAKVGKTIYAPELIYYHYARRLHKLGMLRFWWTWATNEISVMLFNKAKAKEWTPVR